MPKPKERPNIYHVAIHGTGRRIIRIPIRLMDASSPESFFRTRDHVKIGIEGECATCANAEGALDTLGGDGWVFTPSRAIKLKANKKGELKWGTLYTHTQGPFQDRFDKKGKAAMLASPECEGVVRLGIPRPHKPSGPSGPSGPRKPRKGPSRGPLARLERMGIKV